MRRVVEVMAFVGIHHQRCGHALRAQRVPTSLVVYPDEGHHFEDPAHQRDVLQRALGWFEKYLPPSK
jgi:dipeptidyl aminopeptidase/acylaminoacyl peptidase